MVHPQILRNPQKMRISVGTAWRLQNRARFIFGNIHTTVCNQATLTTVFSDWCACVCLKDKQRLGEWLWGRERPVQLLSWLCLTVFPLLHSTLPLSVFAPHFVSGNEEHESRHSEVCSLPSCTLRRKVLIQQQNPLQGQERGVKGKPNRATQHFDSDGLKPRNW